MLKPLPDRFGWERSQQPTIEPLPSGSPSSSAWRSLDTLKVRTLPSTSRASKQLDLYTDQTAAMVRRGVDIIIAPGVELALRSAVAATKTLPIVMVAVDYDPLALGYVPSLSRPGANVTGFTFQQLEQTEKRLQLLRDAFRDLRSATVLWDQVSADQWRIAQQVGAKLGLRLVGIERSGATQDYERLLGEAAAADRD